MQFSLEPLLAFLESLATSISLEFFVVVGAFLEEIIAPIPSPFVMSTAAVLAQVQNYSLVQLAFIVLLASVAKTASSYLVYFAADKFGDVMITYFGKFFGINHSHITKLTKVLTDSKWDEVLLFLARAIPIVPTFPVSVVAGAMKYPVRSYLTATFFGIFLRNCFYLWVAYVGWEQIQIIYAKLLDQPIWIVVGGVALVGAFLILLKGKDVVWEKYLKSLPKAELEKTSEEAADEQPVKQTAQSSPKKRKKSRAN